MKTIKQMLVAAWLLSAASWALADCSYNGRNYPTGTNIGGYICQPNGTWR